MQRPLRVAVVGAGPAGIYAADILAKSDTASWSNLTEQFSGVSIDILEKLPAPYGLIRYGVAPDHPRIKQIVHALQRVLERPEIRFLGNVRYGADLTLDDLRRHYDVAIFATGAEKDRALDIPGIALDGSYGAADFVSWYDGHPDVPRDWPLVANSVAVLGVGNVALDVARILAKTADELLTTEIPDNVHRGLKASPVTDVHVFGRRGPAQAKFTPLELRELDRSPNVEVIVHPEDIEFDQGSLAAIERSNQVRQVVKTLQDWAIRDPGDRPRRLHLHFLHRPVAILGDGVVTGLRTERMELDGTGDVRGTGAFHDWPVQAVYRAVGYLSSHLSELPFDHAAGVVPNEAGRIVDGPNQVERAYVTGWIKRGPVGLIGHTKGDALETVNSILADLPNLVPAPEPAPERITDLLIERGVEYTTLDGWNRLDTHELKLGLAADRERIKVVSREEMIAISRGQQKVPTT